SLRLTASAASHLLNLLTACWRNFSSSLVSSALPGFSSSVDERSVSAMCVSLYTPVMVLKGDLLRGHPGFDVLHHFVLERFLPLTIAARLVVRDGHKVRALVGGRKELGNLHVEVDVVELQFLEAHSDGHGTVPSGLSYAAIHRTLCARVSTVEGNS